MADHNNLRRTIAALQREVPMRPEWRSAILRDVQALGRPSPSVVAIARTPRRWTVRPVVAVAAGLMCAVAGGVIALRLRDARASRKADQLAVQLVKESNGVVRRPTPVRFVFVAPNASTVTIVGDFNAWSPTATPMRRSRAGLWSIDLELPSGRHTYGFVVDGVLHADPDALRSADEDFGVPSSVVLVSDRRT